MSDTDKAEELFAEELALLLLYLSSWTEAEGMPPRAWKNHRFETLRELTSKGYLFDSKGRKSVLFTPEGVAVAEKLAKKYRRRGRLL